MTLERGVSSCLNIGQYPYWSLGIEFIPMFKPLILRIDGNLIFVNEFPIIKIFFDINLKKNNTSYFRFHHQQLLAFETHYYLKSLRSYYESSYDCWALVF